MSQTLLRFLESAFGDDGQDGPRHAGGQEGGAVLEADKVYQASLQFRGSITVKTRTKVAL